MNLRMNENNEFAIKNLINSLPEVELERAYPNYTFVSRFNFKRNKMAKRERKKSRGTDGKKWRKVINKVRRYAMYFRSWSFNGRSL